MVGTSILAPKAASVVVDGTRDVNVVEFPPEDGMFAHADNDIQIARRPAVRSSFLCPVSYALAVARAGLDAHFQNSRRSPRCPLRGRWRSPRDFVAGSHGNADRNVELHAPAGLGNLPGAAAFRALARCFNESVSVTVAASVAAGNIQAHHAAANRGPEGNTHLVFEIAPWFGAVSVPAAPRPPPNMLEKISRKPPPPPLLRARPALSIKSEKSKPPKSK